MGPASFSEANALLVSNLPLVADVYLIAGIVAMAACHLFSPLGYLLTHGRTLPSTDSIFYISKRNFLIFYLVGFVVGLATSKSWSFMTIGFLCHIGRRACETAFVFRESASRMHVLHFIVGALFYPVVWVLMYDATPSSSYPPYALFVSAMFLQFQCHLALARNPDREQLPEFWMFDFVLCPNFSCELAIYASLLWMVPTARFFLLFAFVFINQTSSAVDRLSYYPKAKLKAILPLLL